MKPEQITTVDGTYCVDDLITRAGSVDANQLWNSSVFSRRAVELPEQARLLLDEFPDAEGACCLFLRTSTPATRPSAVELKINGVHKVRRCASGGWMLEGSDGISPSYWIPQSAALRSLDSHGRITAEHLAPILGIQVSSRELIVSVGQTEGTQLDLAVWRIPQGNHRLPHELELFNNLEQQRTYLWSSRARYQTPADLYLHLVHGHFYQNNRAWPRKWKFCCELDAYDLFVWLRGLELATGKTLYNLLRRQILLSVISRQSEDGGWYHGEWTDFKECHYRFHNGSILLLENALEEWPDDLIRNSLARGVGFLASRTDTTDVGPWFLHDSLEDNAEMMDEMYRQTGGLAKGFGAWKPSCMLGKSPTNKMILNTHLDSIIALDRYRELTSDDEHEGLVAAARVTTRNVLARHPAQLLYRLAQGAAGLTMLPESEARKLSLPARGLRRLARDYLLPNLYRLKHRYPRFVMPSGYVERHLSPLSLGATYHAVNVMDLVRFWRRFPEEKIAKIIDDAVHFVTRKDNSILRWWAEARQRHFAVVVFGEALYHLCLQKHDPLYRRQLVDAILCIEDLGLGLPPSSLGGNAETNRRPLTFRCPSPSACELRVIDLTSEGGIEVLVINPTRGPLEFTWENEWPAKVRWEYMDGSIKSDNERWNVPSRGWLWGRGSCPVS